jgi:hypothetical protein
MVYIALAGFLLLADRIAHLVARRGTERCRREALYPLTNQPNWRQPGG